MDTHYCCPFCRDDGIIVEVTLNWPARRKPGDIPATCECPECGRGLRTSDCRVHPGVFDPATRGKLEAIGE